ncbi:DUF2332 family protein [Natronorubrum sp. JWXQ-INN-674]|uniref:DUF2332 family protein n=1 Tax=Natronorubrum halalkaliphilum TaxID=2691917 RepID=A0A6B0VMD5_9EURY|nr:DUF2332 domain-containing protein [Natronorubrum halalkaliphilum]MXV62325.1 DUF2332 family protein [Natronorubrum halalkaliphilum]
MDTAEKFGRYAAWVADESPLYASLAGAAAVDDLLLDIASEARAAQPEPELLLAAVHSLLLDGRDHPLVDFYPSCGGTAEDGDPVPSFRDFCATNEDRLRSIVATRRCQTNDVGRSAVLRPAFEYVAETAGTETVAQIELGSSAGLNLNWDRYRYEYIDDGAVGPSDAPVTIETAVRGDRRPPVSRAVPTVAYRRGIDLNPLDASVEADARWLRALIHPNRVRRHDRLEAALEVAREHRPPLTEGDAVDDLLSHLSDAPDDAALVVYSTHVLYQLEAETLAALRSLLSRYSRDQRVYWLSIDPDEDLGTPAYRLVTFDDGIATETRLARFESYGKWIRWLAPERGSPSQEPS